jgi:hypothetical protein
VHPEVRLAIVRMSSNFFRLGLQLFLGLVVVRAILFQIGDEGWSLIVLLGTGMGLAGLFQEAIRGSIVREISLAYHNSSNLIFRQTYNSAFFISFLAAFLSTLVFWVVVFMLPMTGVSGNLLITARWFALSIALQMFVLITLAPLHNMYLVKEQFVQANALNLMDRASMMVGVTVIFYIDTTVDNKLLIYAWSTTAFCIFAYLITCAHLIFKDSRLLPNPRLITRARIQSISSSSGWNMVVAISDGLHIRADHWLICLLMSFDPWSALFGYGRQLAGYIFQIGVGVASGVEVVATRMVATGDGSSLRKLIHHSTRVHGMVAFPALVLVFLLAEPSIHLWVGGLIQNPITNIPRATLFAQILAFGFTAKAISHGWIRIFYGAGYVKDYAPILLVAGIANPIISVILFLIFPDSIKFLCVACSYSFLFISSTMVGVPSRIMPKLNLQLLDLYHPLVRPFVLSVICSPILVIGRYYVQDWQLSKLILVATSYCGVYGILSWQYTLESSERDQIREYILMSIKRH